MPIVKKAPATMTREIKLEELVNELLEDYARFIESNADHVINAVLKKVLWRDQDYRKWREARRTVQPGPDKAQPVEARTRTSTSSARLDAGTFPKFCSLTDTTQMRICSTTARCTSPSRITHEHGHRVHAAISHRFGLCPRAFRPRGQRCDPCAESLHGSHRSNHRQRRRPLRALVFNPGSRGKVPAGMTYSWE
jgi:hypothetical protein